MKFGPFLAKILLQSLLIQLIFVVNSILASNFPSTIPKPFIYLGYIEFDSLVQKKNFTDIQKQELFLIMDNNKDGIISKSEYESFYSIFTKPFEESCQTNEGSYTLSREEFISCTKNIESLSFLDSLLEDESSKNDFFYALLSDYRIKNVNFYHYILLRRYSFAFKTCKKGEKSMLSLSKEEFTCSLNYVINNQEDFTLIQSNHLFYFAVRFTSKSKFIAKDKISFLEFMFVALQYNNFDYLQNNNNKNALREYNLLDERNSSLIHKLYHIFSLNDEDYFLDFKTYFIWRKANSEIEKKSVISLDYEEFKKTVSDFPQEINLLLEQCKDNITDFYQNKRDFYEIVFDLFGKIIT